jgi:hypothetical protein
VIATTKDFTSEQTTTCISHSYSDDICIVIVVSKEFTSQQTTVGISQSYGIQMLFEL